MAADRETSVFYKAAADFVAVTKSLRNLRREIYKTQAAEKAFNESSVKRNAALVRAAEQVAKVQKTQSASDTDVVKTTRQKTDALRKSTDATRAASKANVRFVEDIGSVNEATGEVVETLDKGTQATNRWASAVSRMGSLFRTQAGETSRLARAEAALERARLRHADSVDSAAIAEQRLAEARSKHSAGSSAVMAAEQRVTRAHRLQAEAARKLEEALDGVRKEGDMLPRVFRNIGDGGDRAYRSLRRFGDWRPRLVPPFIALVPIIGAVIAAINPLMSLMGALGGVALGLASNIGSLAGAFLALPGILGGVAAGIGGVIASMGGVGNVFKTYSAMQKAIGKTPGSTGAGVSQQERAEQLADAEYNLARAQRSVTKAQENLNDARREAMRDLIDLRLEVSRASLNEERAIANLRQTQEEYWNVMADPASTLGDQLDAAVRIKEAEADLQDVRQRNIDNREALTEAERKGVDQSEKVLDAQDALRDAYDAQRDAQRSMRQETVAGGAAGITAINEYNDALAQLSPSARAFVLAILAMQDQWKAFRLELQEDFFSRFVNDLDRLPQAVRNLSAFLRPAVKGMGDLAGAFLRLFTSPAWNSDMVTIGEQNGVVVRNLGDAALSLATALKDIVIAAGPFTDWMTGAFAEGADNFSQMVADARETGSLAGWLEKVRSRLEKWWQIVKNIGATLFNYGAAASGFGDWISDGILEMTENWRKASEAAKEPGSDFRDWLERIKPLLQEVDGLMGDLFGWFGREAMEQGNIDSMTRITELLRDELGPAVGRLLDTLAETDIDEKLISALSSIIESIDTIMENGGSAAFETFFTVVEDFFGFLADFTGNIPKPILEGLLSLFGLLAGITFVGKFTGLTSLLGKMMQFAPTSLTKWKDLTNALKAFSLAAGGPGTVVGGLLAFLTALALPATFAGLTLLSQALSKAAIDSLPEELKDDGRTNNNALNAPTSSGGGGSVIALPKESGDALLEGNIFGEKDNKGPRSRGGGGSFDDPFKGFKEAWAGFQAWWTTELPRFFSQSNSSWGNGWNQLVGGFTSIIGKFQNGWNQIKNFFTVEVPRFFGDIGGKFQNGWNQITTWYHQNFGSKFENGFNQIKTFFTVEVPRFFGDIIGKFKNGWDQITAGVSAAGAAIQEAFRGPVNWVITHVWNNGIRNFWNTTAGKLGLGTWDPIGLIPAHDAGGGGGGQAGRRSVYAKGGVYGDQGVLPGYTPGRDVHDFYSRTGGQLRLSGGEAIMRPEWTRAIGGPKAVAEINHKARTGAFAKGGVYNPKMGSNTGRTTSPKGASRGGDTVDQGGPLFTDPIGYIGNGLKGMANNLLAGMSDNGWSGIVKRVPGRIIDGLVQSVRTWAASSPAGGGGPANALGWQRQWAAVKAAFPGASLNSSVRPGAKTVNGSTSYHSSGRAIDVTPSMEIFNWIRQNYPNSRELIYSPANGRQLMNGQNHFWGGAVRSQHFNHVHWAMRNGGVVPKLYDQGGWMQPNDIGINRTGKPEAVLTNAESQGLKALLAGTGVGQPNLQVPILGSSAANLSSATTQVLDYSVKVESLTLNNPVPEKPSTSLPKSIRQIAYMNQARAGK